MPDTPHARSLIETVARALWESDKLDWVSPDYSQHEAYIKRQAGVAILAVLDAIAEPSDAMLAAAVALPVTEQVNNTICVTAMRYGGNTGLPIPPDSPIQQWYRAMIAELRKEIE